MNRYNNKNCMGNTEMIYVQILNRRPMGHIAHLWNQFKSINTSEKSYDYIKTLIRRGKKPSALSLFWELNGLWSPSLKNNLCLKFGWNWSSGSGEEDENVKSLQTGGRKRDNRQSDKFIWAFSSGELKKNQNQIQRLEIKLFVSI